MWRTRWGYVGPVHDENYKKRFAFPRMVEDLVRIVVPAELLDEFDFSTLTRLSSEYVSDELREPLSRGLGAGGGGAAGAAARPSPR